MNDKVIKSYKKTNKVTVKREKKDKKENTVPELNENTVPELNENLYESACFYRNIGDYELMVLKFIKCISTNHPEINKAINSLIDYYYITKNYKMTKYYLKIGLKKNDINAILKLGRFYEIVEINQAMAIETYISGIKLNSDEAFKALRKYYLDTDLIIKLYNYYSTNSNECIKNAIKALRNVPAVIYFLNNLNKRKNESLKICTRCGLTNILLPYTCGHEECIKCFAKSKTCEHNCFNIFYVFD